MNNIFEWVTEFALLGISTVPIMYKTKIPGHTWASYKENLPTPLELLKWFGGGRLLNYGVVAGWNNLVVLDFDDINLFYEWYLWGAENDPKPEAMRVIENAFMVRSYRGMHVYVSIEEPLHNTSMPGLDIKANGMVLGPGSTHPSGAIYTAQKNEIVIPSVQKLSDILFDDWMVKLNTEPIGVQFDPIDSFADVNDPFESASIKLLPSAVDRIRRSYKIQDILSGVVKSGDNWSMALCPFHKDSNPSFWIDERKQIGNCQKCNFQRPLDVVNIYARLHQMSEGDAIRTLARMI